VIYTSGSTGRPKGISVTHQAVARLVLVTDYLEIRPGDRLGHVSNTAFDATTFEIWGALLNGGAVVAMASEVALVPRELGCELMSQGITHLFLTTVLFNEIAREMPEALGSLQYLLFGGEAVTPRWVQRVLSVGAPRHLLHVYGPTETTTFATWHRVLHVKKAERTVPIGRPIANTRSYVVDRAFGPLPWGVTGELLLGGDGLARGYLGRPDLTAERFVPDPFGEPGVRLYRTGDLVLLLPNGLIEFVGRRDYQVKIRGFRVELEEIESVLGNHPEVDAAAVLICGDKGEYKRLVAYVATEPEVASSLRGYLRGLLPD